MAGVKGIQRFDHLPALGRRIADSALAVMATKEPRKAFFMKKPLAEVRGSSVECVVL
jgi:hypothetical protein